MTKEVLKEAAIILLMIIAITLILGILFYDYIHTNKRVPAKVEAYKLPDEINEELAIDTSANNEIVVKTYTIDGTDLLYYENTNEYDKGKENPFALLDDKEEITTPVNNTENNTTNSTTNTVGNTTTNSTQNDVTNSLK